MKMPILSFLHKRVKSFIRKVRRATRRPGFPSGTSNLDDISVHLNGLKIFMKRWFTLGANIPHEVSVIIPRAEIRIRKTLSTQETEIILSSITVVHSPRYPPTMEIQLP